MYNDSSIFVAIDEMDAGIFEYLLGEILKTICESGKGQLLFTSHNMRPLEVLDNSNIYFTTTNPDNKYIQFTGVKNNSFVRIFSSLPVKAKLSVVSPFCASNKVRSGFPCWSL